MAVAPVSQETSGSVALVTAGGSQGLRCEHYNCGPCTKASGGSNCVDAFATRFGMEFLIL